MHAGIRCDDSVEFFSLIGRHQIHKCLIDMIDSLQMGEF